MPQQLIDREAVLREIERFMAGGYISPYVAQQIRGAIAALPDASPQGPVSEPPPTAAPQVPLNVADSKDAIPWAPAPYLSLREQQAIWDKYRIESDESFTECIERTIEGWRKRALKAEGGGKC